jgi:pyruvate dehydrogenase E1 component alpha subunit
VHKRVTEIVAEMRETNEPFFLECMTTRYHGHGAADDAKQYVVYRSREEVEKAKQRDPIHILEATLFEKNLLTDADRDRIHSEAVDAAKAALKFADDSPNPTPDELLKDVYA